jgi:hypothetical protein
METRLKDELSEAVMRNIGPYWMNRSPVKYSNIVVLCAAALLVACDKGREPMDPTAPPAGVSSEGEAPAPQFLQEPIQTASILSQLALASQTMSMSNPTNSAEELPGLGHKFELFFGMVDDQDPNNVTNDVISVVTTPATIGEAYRNFPPGIKIAALDDQINLKYYFVAPRSCGGGNPRVTLLIDANGDGVWDQSTGDFAAQGHVNPPLYAGCTPDVWHIEDMTDELKRWETTPLVALSGGVVPLVCGPIGAATTCTWEELETRVTAAFPNHKVLSGFLHDGDACSFFTPACGKAYYDLFTLENRTLENDQDTVH